jgi:hypothetical protein
VANRLFDAQDVKAVAVLATATVHVVGRDAPVVASLQRLLRERNRASYDAAVEAFDGLGAEVRDRIARSAPSVARRKLKTKTLPGLLRALNRMA